MARRGTRRCRPRAAWSSRPVPLDGDPVQDAPVVVIGDGVVLGAPVVQEEQRPLVPADTAMELRRFDVVVEEGQDHVALVFADIKDSGRGLGIDKESPATRLRMGDDHGMDHRRIFGRVAATSRVVCPRDTARTNERVMSCSARSSSRKRRTDGERAS